MVISRFFGVVGIAYHRVVVFIAHTSTYCTVVIYEVEKEERIKKKYKPKRT